MQKSFVSSPRPPRGVDVQTAKPDPHGAGRQSGNRVGRAWRSVPIAVRWGAPPLITLLLVVAFFAFVFQWNWLRVPIADWAGANLHRRVSISGELRVRPWSWSPSATVDGLTIANPAWAGPGPMAKIPRLSLSVSLPDLLLGRLVLPLVSASQPDVRLFRASGGRSNWNFSADSKSAPLRIPPIRHLVIVGGAMRLEDQPRKLVFSATLSTDEQSGGGARGQLRLNGQGARDGQTFQAQIAGGPLLDLDPGRPYPFQARVQSGVMRVFAQGTIPHPFDLNRFTAHVQASGDDLAQLYRVTQVILPRTPPFNFTADLTRRSDKMDIRGIRGRFGDSDLAGALVVDDSSGRRRLTGDLISQRLRLADLAAVFGGGPRRLQGHTVSPEQVAEATRLRAEHRLLPDIALRLDRLPAMDANVTYRARSMDDSSAPVRDFQMTVRLDHGVLLIDPLSAGLRSGELTGSVRIDGRGARPTEMIDLRLAKARVEQWIGKAGAKPPVEGELMARVRLSGSGDSVREAASGASGGLTLVIPHGEIRRGLAELLGIDVADAAFLLLTKSDQETPVRCAVADFRASDGVLTTQRIVLDTGVVLAAGSGTINLRDETLNLRLDGKPKKFRLLRIGAPITLTGRLESPKVRVDVAKAAPQLALAGVLGFVVAPLAAVLPFVNPGLAHDADCSALLAEASGHVAPTPVRSH